MSSNKTRVVSDYLGSIEISNNSLWDIQTQRAIDYLSVGDQRTPLAIIRSYLVLKKATAQANYELGKVSGGKTKAILDAIEVLLEQEEQVVQHFPISIWQSGCGNQTNMNVNEVIANLASKNSHINIHAHDDVNASQASSDTFASVLHMATIQQCIHKLMPAISKLRSSFGKLETRYAITIKIARTHLQDALPITYGQFFSAYQSALSENMNHLHNALDSLFELAIGATSVGSGFGAPNNFDELVVQHLSDMWKLPFVTCKNKFSAISMHTALLHFAGCLNNLACVLNKIANDIQLLGSGPRSGIGELLLPENEAGSSIMPGKVNATQCEILSMVCLQVLSNYQSIATGCANGQLELNSYKPLIGNNILNSIKIISDAMQNFDAFCIRGLMVHENNTRKNLEQSLMLVTALTNDIGYDKAREVAHLAYSKPCTIREACLELGYLAAERLDILLDPSNMISNTESQVEDIDY